MTDEKRGFLGQPLKQVSSPASFENGPFSIAEAWMDMRYELESC